MKIGLLLVVLQLLVSFNIQASALCENPNPQGPALSFSMTVFRGGELDSICRGQLEKARDAGFTQMALIPAFAVGNPERYADYEGEYARPKSTAKDGEIYRCLEMAWDMGFDIVYQPHLEAVETLNSRGEAIWRARFDIKPDEVYMENLFREFFEWVTIRADEIIQNDQKVSVIVASELETSTAYYAGEWLLFVRNFRLRLEELGLNNILLGFNPNWDPYTEVEEEQVKNFGDFISEVDFVAPSAYGNCSNIKKDQAGERWNDIKNNLVNTGVWGLYSDKKFPQYALKPWAIGEFGIGGSLSRAEGNLWPLKNEEDDWILKRREIYKNFLWWAYTEGNDLLYINLWTLGIFDPIGCSNSGGICDPEIRTMLQDYSFWRCSLE